MRGDMTFGEADRVWHALRDGDNPRYPGKLAGIAVGVHNHWYVGVWNMPGHKSLEWWLTAPAEFRDAKKGETNG